MEKHINTNLDLFLKDLWTQGVLTCWALHM